jgi:5-(carboxyamino)imidazole ribonucleotide synthase
VQGVRGAAILARIRSSAAIWAAAAAACLLALFALDLALGEPPVEDSETTIEGPDNGVEGVRPQTACGADLSLPAADDAEDQLGYSVANIGGYDGRSQWRLASAADVERHLETHAVDGPILVERELDFTAELSVVVARAADGTTLPYPPARNSHDAGILVESVVPSGFDEPVVRAAQDLGELLATGMGLVGVLTVELFLMPDGSLVVNELAPRVHNSGHWTIEGSATSQFEQHVRAICGIPLGDVSLRAPAAAMVNLLGEGPRRAAEILGLSDALRLPDVHVHLYDKREVFERRKMGHVTALGATPDEALATARNARAALSWGPGEARDGRG